MHASVFLGHSDQLQRRQKIATGRRSYTEDGGTKTVAKAVVDAKMKVLRIPAGDWKKMLSLLLKIEGICRLKSATQSVV